MSSNKGLLHNTWHLGMKEFHSLLGDWTMLFLIVFMFTVSVYADARAKPESLHRASIGVFMGTLARNMPQFGLMSILVLLPLQILSGALTPRESMPDVVRGLMSLTPTTHFVSLAQGVLFRGAGIEVVWPEFLMVAAIGTLFFALAHHRLRSTIGTMQN